MHDQAFNHRQCCVLEVWVLLSERAFDLLINKLNCLLVGTVVFVALSQMLNTFVNNFGGAITHLFSIVPLKDLIFNNLT
jgi:hypothetical protein